MTQMATPGRVDKVIRIVAVSPTSWEDAAQNAVAEAAKSIRDLTSAHVVEQDLTVTNGAPRYRIKLQLAFQVDRSRTDAVGATVEVRRYLVLANDTLTNPGLRDFMRDRAQTGTAEFHIVVPQVAPSVLHADPSTGLIGPAAHSMLTESRQASRAAGEQRLAAFQASLGDLGTSVTGEVVLAEPVTAARAVMSRAAFDEIIVSTLPPGISRWLKLDLPSRIERSFNLPVTTLHAS